MILNTGKMHAICHEKGKIRGTNLDLPRYVPALNPADHLQLFYDFGVVWAFKVSVWRALMASDFIRLDHRLAGIQFYDSCNPHAGRAWLVNGANENYAGSGDAAGIRALYDFSV